MKYIKYQENLNGKIILLRLDLNVPLKDGVITDETRIDKVLPVIKFLLANKAKILVISHVGRPKGKSINRLSLKPICENIENKINIKIKLINENIFKLRKNDFFKDPKDQLIFLENIRFYEEEEKNDITFSEQLSKLADIYVNDAFSCSHREHASVSNITRFIPSFAGLQLQTEISALKKITSEIKKPISCIVGGSKVSTKIGLIKNLIQSLIILYLLEVWLIIF